MAQRQVTVHPEAVAEAQAAYRWYHDRNETAARAVKVNGPAYGIFRDQFDSTVEFDKESLLRELFSTGATILFYRIF